MYTTYLKILKSYVVFCLKNIPVLKVANSLLQDSCQWSMKAYIKQKRITH